MGLRDGDIGTNHGQTYDGPKVCAFNRSAMLTGAAATQQCFQLSSAYYYYKVSAVNSVGEGPQSNEAFDTPLPADN